MYTNYDDKGNIKHDCKACSLPLRTRKTLGCPVSGYKEHGYNGQICTGYYFAQEIKEDFQELWYLREFITNILDEPNTLKELFYHRKFLEIELQKIHNKVNGVT